MMMSGKCSFLILAVLVAADLLAGARPDACAPADLADVRLEVWRSADDGANWAPWRVLEKEKSGEFSYPCIIEPRPGTLVVTYTWKRQRIAFVGMALK